MKDKIKKYIQLLTRLTKDEADLIESFLRLNDEERAAFLLAKRIFEDEEE